VYRLFSDNVLEILRVGLSGLCFLLSVLAFWLIHLEQGRRGDPRKGILQAIYVFMLLNLVASGFVAMASSRHPSDNTGVLAADTYLVDYTSYLVDLSKWTPEAKGPVYVTRSDYVNKVSDKHVDYVLPYYTTGDRIDWTPLNYSRKPTFVKKDAPGTTGTHYDYRLHIGDEPAGFSEMVSNQFTFTNGFKDPKSEWWQASAAYPSKVIALVFRFPNNKPCKSMSVFKIAGIRDKEPITENVPVITNEGLLVTWVGLNVEGNSRIEFDWEW